MKALFWTSAVLFLVSAVTSAEQIVIDFTEPSSKLQSIFALESNNNTGQYGMEVLGGPNQANNYEFDGLLYCDLSAVTGMTINFATFHVAQDGWGWSGCDNVEVRRFTSSENWVQGSGPNATWSERWNIDNGAGARMMDWDTVAGSGTDWAGNFWTWLNGANRWTNYIDSTVWDCEHIPSGGGGVDFDMTSLVQAWADNTYTNNGWVMWAGNANGTTAAHLATPTLTIDYIPQPASILLIGTVAVGLLGLARRRRMK